MTTITSEIQDGIMINYIVSQNWEEVGVPMGFIGLTGLPYVTGEGNWNTTWGGRGRDAVKADHD